MDELVQTLYEEIRTWPIVDIHTHINPRAAAASSLDEILGYHYYTELAHSAGMPKSLIEDPSIDPKEHRQRKLFQSRRFRIRQ